MIAKLSPKMQEAVELCKLSPYEKLFRWPGGFWLAVPQKGLDHYKATAFPYAKTLTIEALVKRKIFVRDESSRDVYLTVVRLSDEEIQSTGSDSAGPISGRQDIPGDVAAHAASIGNLPR